METLKRTFWCPRCSGVERANRWLKGTIAVLLLIEFILVGGIAFGAVQDQTWEVGVGLCEVWEPKQPGEKWRESYGAWLQELVGLKPQRNRYGIACYGDGPWDFDRQLYVGQVTGVILETRGLVRCKVAGEWTDNEVDYCIALGVLCDDGQLVVGQTVCSPSAGF